MIRLVPVFFILLGCSHSADVDWAAELVVQTEVRENLQNAIAACTEFSKDLIGEEYKLNEQIDNLGLGAEDPAWFELAEIYEGFYEQACNYVDVDELSTMYADEYRNRFSDSELQEIVKFHRSEIGSKFVAVNSEISTRMNQVINQKMAEGSVEARAMFEAQLQEFWLRQDMSPKDDGSERQL